MNPFISIWTQPKKTVQYMIEHKSIPYGLVLIMFSAAATSILAFADTGFFADFSLLTTIILAIFMSSLISILAWGITTAVYTWVGKFLGGTGTMRNMCLAVATSSIPMIWTLPINVLAIILYGKTLFTEPTGNFGITNMSFSFFLLQSLITLGVSIFGTIVLSKGIGIVHHFSSWRGFGTIMLATAIALVLFFIIGIGLVFLFFSISAA